MIPRLIWRNLWRNRRRTYITMMSVMFAVMLSVFFKSLQMGVWDNLIDNIVRYYSGYIQIHSEGYWNEQVIDNGFADNDSLDRLLSEASIVKSYSSRLESYALISSDSGTRGSFIAGIDPEREAGLTGLDQKVVKGKFLERGDQSVMMAEGAARLLKLDLNDTLIILGQGYHGAHAAGKFPITGIVHFGSPELNDNLVLLPLNVAQQFFNAENIITTIAIDLNKADELDEAKSELLRNVPPGYEVMTWTDMMPEIDSHIKADNFGFYIQIGILYLVIAFGIFGTMLMMTSERRYEFGMLIAIGMKKYKIALMVVGETILISILGAVAGMILSLPLVQWFKVHPITFTGQYAEVLERFGFEPIYPTILKWDIFLNQGLAVLAIAVLVALFPLFIVQRVKPATAMKR